MSELWTVALIVLVLNLPFGYWRAGVRKYSVPWVLAIHVPVPIVIGLRFASGLGWRPVTFPVLIGAFFTGQFLGGAIRRRRYRPSPLSPETAAPPERTRKAPSRTDGQGPETRP